MNLRSHQCVSPTNDAAIVEGSSERGAVGNRPPNDCKIQTAYRLPSKYWIGTSAMEEERWMPRWKIDGRKRNEEKVMTKTLRLPLSCEFFADQAAHHGGIVVAHFTERIHEVQPLGGH